MSASLARADARMDAVWCDIRQAAAEPELARLLSQGPVYVQHPGATRQAVTNFQQGFPGTTLYAVKANDLDTLLLELHENGVCDFDVASLQEIEKVRGLCPRAQCHFMNPIKPAEAIRIAYKAHGVRTFAVDCGEELRKVHDAVDGDPAVRIAVRIAVSDGSAAVSIGGKFGASPPEASELLRTVTALGLLPGVTFHVGGQCEAVAAYGEALELVSTIAARAGVKLRLLDVGGGFPGGYAKAEPPLEAYFAAIRERLPDLPLAPGADLFCEPGRGLVADAMSVLTRVELCRGQDVFINDGVYGALSELPLLGARIPVALIRGGEIVRARCADHRLLGPTCNNVDVMAGPFRLPADVRPGDWLLLGQLGSYSLAIRTRFNGFYSDQLLYAPVQHRQPLVAAE